MTCIVGVEHKGRVYMGGDSAAVSGWNISQTAERKVFMVGDFIIGYTTSFRMGQLLEYELRLPEYDGPPNMGYMVSWFVPAVRDCLKDGGFTRIENNREEGGLFLVGWGEYLFEIGEDFQVLRNLRSVAAIGCGADYALGALAMMAPFDDITPDEAVIRALKIAGAYSAGVCGPYYVVEADHGAYGVGVAVEAEHGNDSVIRAE